MATAATKKTAAAASASTASKAAAAPAETSNPKKTKAAAAAKPEPVGAAPAAEATAEAGTTDVEKTTIAKLEETIKALAAMVSRAGAELKALKKENDKMAKAMEKIEKKKARARTAPSGFSKPTGITDELCTFLGVPSGTKISRTEVTRAITAYVKNNSLNVAENKRFFVPDDKLRTILRTDKGAAQSYFALQKLLKHCFVKEQQ